MKKVLFFLSILLLAHNPVYAEKKTSKVITNYDEVKKIIYNYDYNYNLEHQYSWNCGFIEDMVKDVCKEGPLADTNILGKFMEKILGNNLARVTHVTIDRKGDKSKELPIFESMFIIDNISDLLGDALREYFGTASKKAFDKYSSDDKSVRINPEIIINRKNFELIITDQLIKPAGSEPFITRRLSIKKPDNAIITYVSKLETPEVVPYLKGKAMNEFLHELNSQIYYAYEKDVCRGWAVRGKEIKKSDSDGDYSNLKKYKLFPILYPDKNNYSTPVTVDSYSHYSVDISYSTYYDAANSYIEAIRSANKKIDESELLESDKVIKIGSDYMMLIHKFTISSKKDVLHGADSDFLYKGSNQKVCKKLEQGNSIECIMPAISKNKDSIYKNAIVVGLDIENGYSDNRYKMTFAFLNDDKVVNICGVRSNGD